MTDKPTKHALGGIARAKALSPERRAEIASAAGKARWAKFCACKEQEPNA